MAGTEYQVLARRWRPQNFSMIVGQPLAVQMLQNALSSQRLHHAYLFVGTRGVGKTTLARIFSKALNCAQGITSDPCGECIACQGVLEGCYPDLIEIDAASKTGVDDTRDILENVQYAPSDGRFKIYLIDEVHMFSKASFNALLKTLEEPPSHVKFLLATTDLQKLPITVLSRCLQIRLQHVDDADIVAHFAGILDQEGVSIDDKHALDLLARAAKGSIRDGLSLLDQALALGNGAVQLSLVKSMLGIVADSQLYAIVQSVVERDAHAMMEALQSTFKHSTDYIALLSQLIECLHQLALMKHLGKAAQVHGRMHDIASWETLSEQIPAENIQLLYDLLNTAYAELKNCPDMQMAFEMLLLRLIAFQPSGKVSEATLNDSNQVAKHNTPKQDQVALEITNLATVNAPVELSEREQANVQQEANIVDLPTVDNWGQWLERFEATFTPILRQFLRQSSLVRIDGKKWYLAMDDQHFAICNDKHREQLVRQLEKCSISTVDLHITKLSASKDTTVHQKRIQDAEAAMLQDNVLQKAIEDLDLHLDKKGISLRE